MTDRILTPRTSTVEFDVKEFDYPFMYTHEFGQTSLPMIDNVPVGNFPDNIVEWIWARPGENDGPHWWALLELEPDEEGERYVFYDAWCDYTGFDCQAGIDLICARDLSTLIQYAMTNAAYEQYIQDTK